MIFTCPHCGGALAATGKYRGELERELGDEARADTLRQRAAAWSMNPEPLDLGGGFLAWRGFVWSRVRLRKPAKCEVTGAELAPGAWAWRQLSEVRDRDLRVSAEAPGPWSS